MKSATKKIIIILCFALCLYLFPLGVFSQKGGGRVTASASGDIIKIHSFHADMTVQTDRKVVVTENITVEFLASGLTMFYRSLPTDGAMYSDISAKCAGNNNFTWHVADNPDISGFIDINCVGNANRGKTWTYEIKYTMLGTVNSGDAMIIDIVPFGFTVPLNDVKVDVHFPTTLEGYTTYVGFGSEEKNPQSLTRTLSEDKKTLTINTERLNLSYVDEYEERVADGITLHFLLPKGVLKSYAQTHIATRNTAWLIITGAVFVGVAVLALVFFRKKRDIITVVNFEAPDRMDPLAMGKALDGTVDSEDITSMLYYFAHKGYLSIDFSDEENPVLTTHCKALPNTESAHARTLFKGLFKNADERIQEGATPFDEDVYTATTSVSALTGKFYESVEKAKIQLPKKRMYEKKSIFGFLCGAILGIVYALFASAVASVSSIGGGYVSVVGVVACISTPVVCLLGYVRENYRYKWKKNKQTLVLIAQIAVSAIISLIFCVFFAKHFLSVFERVFLCTVVNACNYITLGALSRDEKYCQTLGQILGFKDFIVYTEEDKIKFMLEENPELYYKVLPYAQVLGVTDEWEGKFKDITLQPPSWCMGTELTYFDYYIINRCMTRSMLIAIAPPKSEGGSTIGRSGGGGGFGGFGGGGFGGGGGGAR